jgi:phage host-nuclease inhibitor protein Gam
MKSRIKIPLAIIASRDQAERAMNELALAENHKRNLIARLDTVVLKFQDEAAPALAACDTEIKARTDALRVWAESNPREFAAGRKSIPLLSGTLGFRTGTPRLALMSRTHTWDGVLDLLHDKGWTGFIRTRTEPDKESLLAQRDRCNLGEVGLKVVQDESFYIEPRLTGGSAGDRAQLAGNPGNH